MSVADSSRKGEGKAADYSKRMFLTTHDYSNLGFCSSLLSSW